MAVSTPLGAFEWLVMPMGFQNAPPAQQCQMTNAHRKHIGTICHIYMDDIVIWSQDLTEHKQNVHTIMNTLQESGLHVNKKKNLFSYEINFLGHIISQRGVE